MGAGEGKPRPGTADDGGRAWGKSIAGQAISIATDKAAYAPSQRIVLNIRLKNVGKVDVRLSRAYVLYDYDVTVLLVGGRDRNAAYDGPTGPVQAIPENGQVPHTLLGKVRLESGRGGGHSYPVLKPGQYAAAAIDLTRLFDMSLEGKYVVSVKRSVLSGGGVAKEATSNELEVTVDGRLGNPIWQNLGKGPTPEEAKEKAGK